MKTTLGRLLTDERGAADSVAYLLLVSIIALGSIVGLASFRDQVAQEFGDVGTAINSLDQSFSVIGPGMTVIAEFNDIEPDGDPDENTDTAGSPPGCMEIGN